MRPSALLILAACQREGEPPRFRHGTPALGDAIPALPLVRELTVRLDRPAHVRVRLEDDRGVRTLTFPDETDALTVPLLGLLPDETVVVNVQAERDGVDVWSGPQAFRTGSLPERFPILDTVVPARDDVTPGLLLFPTESIAEDLGYVVAVDEHDRVVWLWEAPLEFGDVRLDSAGTLLALAGGVAWRVSLTGEILSQWGAVRVDPAPRSAFVPIDANTLNHELFPTADGAFLSITPRARLVGDYPCSYDAPTVSCGPATLQDAEVIHFDPNGVVRWRWSLVDALDPFRIGFDSLDALGELRDWAHANGVIVLPDQSVLVSVRHQDALAAFAPDGQLSWILGNPDGWSDALRPYLLQPVGEPFAWPWHQHGPAVGDDGTLWMFDNGDWGGSPYAPADPGHVQQSRVVGYRVDAQARTVEQVASFSETGTGWVYSRALGNAQPLGGGHVLGVWGMPTSEGATLNEDLGYGSRYARMVEFDAQGDVVRDLRVRSDVEVEPLGWRSYRAVHVPSLYPPGIEQWEE
ncbi:MAG: aryl-sulfate sulfotransferase [Myxococcota bacterium]